MARGRTRSTADDAAVLALTEAEEYLRLEDISPTALARRVHASPASVLRALGNHPPAWTPTFTKINNFIILEKTRKQAAAGTGLQEHLTRSALGPAHATASLLRAIADLLEKQATPQA